MSDGDINKMNFKQLKNEVQLLRDELAIFKRKYEDAIYNLDSDNFAKGFTLEQNNMKAQIKISAEAIKTTVSKTDLDTRLESYSTKEQTAEKILQTVSKTYVTNMLSGEYATQAELSTEIEQTAEKISAVVNASYSNPTEVYSFSSYGKDKSLVYYESSENLYWHYDGDKWVSSENGNFGSVFEQTANGFSLKGNVKISGDLITSGTISADRISTEIGQVANSLYLGDGQSIETKSLIFGESARISGVLDGIGVLSGIKTSSSSIRFNDLTLADSDDSSPRIYANDKLLATQEWVKANSGSGTVVAVFG